MHDHHQYPAALQYLNFISGLSCVYLVMQALFVSRGIAWIRLPVMIYAGFTLLHTIVLLLAWVGSVTPLEPFYVFILRILPSLALLAAMARYFYPGKSRSQFDDVHKD